MLQQSCLTWRDLSSNSPLDFSTFAYLGLFAINQFCFTLGLRYTNVTHSSIIVGLAPIYTLTLAV